MLQLSSGELGECNTSISTGQSNSEAYVSGISTSKEIGMVAAISNLIGEISLEQVGNH